MTILPIVTYPDPQLKESSAEVTEFNAELGKLIDDMIETMYDAPGIGLAAVQIGVLKRVIVFDCSDEGNAPDHIINPEIVSSEGTIDSEEGCLSIPSYRETIQRASRVNVCGYDKSGKRKAITAEGILARCLQHEIDHTNGLLYIDHFGRIKKEMFQKWVKRQEWFKPQ